MNILQEKMLYMQAGGKQAGISPRIEGWVGLRNPYVHPNMDRYNYYLFKL